MTLVEARPRAGAPPRASARRRGLPARSGSMAVILLAAVAAVHAAVVAPHYHVGSFDDDGHYLALAHAFMHGHGYVDTSLAGSPTETLYPPGYPALLVPLLWLFGGATWPLRVLSAVAFVACVPLTEMLMRRHRVPAPVRLGALALLALSPVAATFATMVMPETAFLVVLLAVLLALPRWEEQQRLATRAGAVVCLGAPALLLLKSAALPMVVAVVLWLALRRQLRRAAAVGATSLVLLAPIAIARLAAGSVVGDRYAGEYSRQHGVVGGVLSGVHHYIDFAIPASILQWFSVNLAHHGALVSALLFVFRYSAAALVVLGWAAWVRRRRDVTLLLVPLYLVETLPFPYINERRVVLLLPLVLAWYALGWWTLGAALRRAPWRRVRAVSPALAGALVLLIVVAVAVQFPRNYLLSPSQNMSDPGGSGYVAAVHDETPPTWNVATSYRWTIAYYSARTARNEAFLDVTCPSGVGPGFATAAHTMLQRERAATVLIGAMNRPTWIDSPCLLSALSTASWAVPVYDGADSTVLFALLGPGTARPAASVVVADPRPATSLVGLPSRVPVSEVSVDVSGSVAHTVIQVRRADGSWLTLAAPRPAAARGPVLLVVRLARPVEADAVRVVGAPAGDLSHLVVLRGR